MTSNRASVPDIRDPAILKGPYAEGTRAAVTRLGSGVRA